MRLKCVFLFCFLPSLINTSSKLKINFLSKGIFCAVLLYQRKTQTCFPIYLNDNLSDELKIPIRHHTFTIDREKVILLFLLCNYKIRKGKSSRCHLEVKS